MNKWTVYMMAPDPFESWVMGQPVWKPNDEQRDKYFVLSLSGGKDSTAMLLYCLEYDIYLDEVVFVDTGKEFPEMYEHIDSLEELVKPYGIKFTRLKAEKPYEYWLGEHVKTKGKNKGKKGYGWPDFQNRWCTYVFKRDVLKKYYKKIMEEHEEPVDFIGIAVDEEERVNHNDKRHKEYPLINMEITEEEALEYCYSWGFDWGGLYEKLDRVSCYLCPLARLNELKYVFEHYPWLWLEMRMLDDMSYRDFRNDYTLAELERKFIQEFYEELWGLKQMSLFAS